MRIDEAMDRLQAAGDAARIPSPIVDMTLSYWQRMDQERRAREYENLVRSNGGQLEPPINDSGRKAEGLLQTENAEERPDGMSRRER